MTRCSFPVREILRVSLRMCECLSNHKLEMFGKNNVYTSLNLVYIIKQVHQTPNNSNRFRVRDGNLVDEI